MSKYNLKAIILQKANKEYISYTKAEEGWTCFYKDSETLVKEIDFSDEVSLILYKKFESLAQPKSTPKEEDFEISSN